MNFSFNKKYFSDEQIIDYVNQHIEHITIISVAHPETGYHYMSPVWTIFHDGKFYLSTDDNNVKGRLVDN
ncbi:MAG: hypothetical protein ACXAC2_13240, partial [Candidatus Kariarchaeaceae archaeon]